MQNVKQKKDRYEMHKYWGKKPSGDLGDLIKKYSKEGDTLLDPFSGYGVFACEAYLMNRNIISNDLNPVASFLNTQLLETNIDLDLLNLQWQRIKNELVPFVDKWYSYTLEGRKATLTSILRSNDNRPLKAKIKIEGEKGSREIEFTKQEIESFLNFEESWVLTDWYPDNELIINSRISAKKGMTVADLFTKRTLACHSKLLSLIDKFSSDNERDLLLVAFSANLANCSKLVPPIKSRGEMSQGAWMTGFYTGPTYIENNVLVYFENRFKKIVKGKQDYLQELHGVNPKSINTKDIWYKVTTNDAKNLKLDDNSIDYIFTDPPYGGAVPYFEQSIIWNSWLKFSPDYDKEIVVTDSKARNKNTDSFEVDINEAFAEIGRVLKKDKYFSFTYHSLSGFEWRAITNACILNGFKLHDYMWLVQKSFTPRQINRATSIKGDVLVTLQKVSDNVSVLEPTVEEATAIFVNSISKWLQKDEMDTNEIFLRIMKKIFSDKIIIRNVNLLTILKDNFTFTENNTWTNK
jgi:adenine-specific DNA methylase